MISILGHRSPVGTACGRLCYMSRPLLEVIAVSAEDAVAARAGGADRLEVVADMAADGTTPSRELFARVRAAVDLPLRVMLRLPDASERGERCTPAGLEELRTAAGGLRAEGADEFVLGLLDGDGLPDLDALHALLDVVGGCAWTFHRAIDRGADRAAVRARIAGLPGLDACLTAGSPHGVDQGLGTLLAEATGATAAPGGPRLLVGGGLRTGHLPVLRSAGIDAFHVGGAVRPAGWAGPVDPSAVRAWRSQLDAPAAVVPA
jgi:copper homeostasis protein